MTTLAEPLVEVLVQAHVRRTHGVVGDSPGLVVDVVRRSPVDRVCVRNEGAGDLAAGEVVLAGGVGSMPELPCSNPRRPTAR